MRYTSQGKGGFTLIELMIVVLVVGILTSIALPQYTRSLKRAKLTEGMTLGKTIYDSAVRYLSENGGGSPTKFDVLDVSLDYEGNLNTSQIIMGDFNYELNKKDVSVRNNSESYTLKFTYPTEESDGIYASVLCCPKTNKVCKTMGTTVEDNCIKIK